MLTHIPLQKWETPSVMRAPHCCRVQSRASLLQHSGILANEGFVRGSPLTANDSVRALRGTPQYLPPVHFQMPDEVCL
jgi:hypothetical protein